MALYWDSYPLSILEAMASGLPVVTTDDDVRRWMLDKYGGITVDPTDIQAYAKALKAAYERGYDHRARKHLEEFSWEVNAQRYENLLIETHERKHRK